ncbi:MAG TPA: twin-arginine translocase subunit TatB [Thioalkalivibrio sp.]|nr:twin-arginine translocase subunit TatB [Thioalkalivibrio sp.]
MFDAGITEFLLIMVVALLVVGPERLPGLARKAGYWMGRARSYVQSMRSDIEREFQADEFKRMLGEQEEELNRLKRMMDETREQVKQEVDETEYLVRALPDEPAVKGDTAPRIADTTADQPADDSKPHERKPE